MTQLSEHKTYRTRDWSRTGVRVVRSGNLQWPWRAKDREHQDSEWRCDGSWGPGNREKACGESPYDLIEETPDAPRPFSYDACPMHEDGRRRAVTRDGREVVLLSDQGPNGKPIVGYLCADTAGSVELQQWREDGRLYKGDAGWNTQSDLLVPPLPKRVVWVNLYDNGDGIGSVAFESREAADAWTVERERLGGRAHAVEV